MSLVGLAISYAIINNAFPWLVSNFTYVLATYALYPVWGMALGKRSRDLGTTFTYGMLIGMVFPIIGIVFLFQKGVK